jgi:hypothetical protein
MRFDTPAPDGAGDGHGQAVLGDDPVTTDEFTGHLLAALHGPMATEIAGRVLVAALSDPTFAETFGEMIGEVLPSEQMANVLDLEMLAHLDGLEAEAIGTRPSMESMQRKYEIRKARTRLVDRIRSRLRETMGKSEAGRTVAASIHLNMPGSTSGGQS